MRISGMRPWVLVLPILAFACADETPPDIATIDVPPVLDSQGSDRGRDLVTGDPGGYDPGGEVVVTDIPVDAEDTFLPADTLEGPGRIDANPASLDLGTAMYGGLLEQTLRLVNVGETPVSILSVGWLEGADPDFSVQGKGRRLQMSWRHS